VIRDELIDRTRELLSAPDLQRFDLRILEEDVRQDNGWWLVPVWPHAEGVGVFDYAGRLHDIEDTVESEKGIRMLIVPWITD